MKRITLLHLGFALALAPACGDDGIAVAETEEGTDDTGTAETTAAPTQSTTITTTGTPPTTGDTEDPPTTGDTEDPPPTTGDTEDPPPTTGDTESDTEGDTEGDTEDDTGSTGAEELCGNGEIDGDEECDDGDDNADTAACKSDCTNQVCGDTFVGPDEACDDGNTESNDGCSSMCLEDGGTTCEAPYYVEALPYSHDGDTTNAGNDYSFDTCPGLGFPGNAANNEATYSFTPAADGIYTVSVTSGIDILLYVATDCSDIDGTCVGAADGAFAGGTESLFLDGVADTNYFIHTGHYGDDGATGDGEYTLTVEECIPADCDESFCGDDGCGGTCSCADGDTCDESGDEGVCVSPPEFGDTCGEAIVVDATMLPYTDSSNTLLYMNDYNFSAGACPGETGQGSQDAEDVVYEFTPEATGIYEIVFDTSWDSVVWMATDCDDMDGSCVEGADNGNPETINPMLEAGTTYFIIGSHWINAGSGGDYTLTISDVCMPMCTEGMCGDDDGCGGTCGCDDGEVCNLEDGTPGTCELAPVGDTCGDAIVIDPGGLPYSDDGDTLLYSDDYGFSSGSCPGETGFGGNGAEDVVYSFTPDVAGVYEIVFDTSWDSVVWMATDCDDVNGTCVEGADNGNPETINPTLEAGTTYFIMGSHWNSSGSGGDYTLTVSEACVPAVCDEVSCGDDGCGGTCGCADGDFCGDDDMCAPVPAGDTCEDPISVDSLPFSQSGTTTVYGNDYGVTSPACPGVGSINNASQDVVFSYTAEADGDYLFEFDAAWDNALYVVTDCADIDNSCIGGVDAVGSGAEIITVSLTSGVTYFFVAGPYQNISAGAGGDYTANLSGPM